MGAGRTHALFLQRSQRHDEHLADRSGPEDRAAIRGADGVDRADRLCRPYERGIGRDHRLRRVRLQHARAIDWVRSDRRRRERCAYATSSTGQRAWLHPDVSRDGRFLALRSFKAQEDVWVVAVDGSGLRPVTNDPPRDRGPRWAADGSLLFYSARNGRFQFWTIQSDGSGIRQLTHGDNVVNDPVPSRDGRWIGGSNPNTGEQFIFDAHDWTKPPDRLPSPPTKSSVYLRDWSPDGSRSPPPIHRVCSGCSTSLRKSWDRIGPGSWPRWLPDGRRLVVTSRSRVILVERRQGQFAMFITSRAA